MGCAVGAAETSYFSNPMADQTWHYLENQFDNSTRNSRKRMNILIEDHAAKLTAGAGGNATVAAARTALVTPRTNWQSAYQSWRNASAAYQAATLTLENALAVLRRSPGPGLRSKIDEWESKVAAFWGQGSPHYEYLFPRGREPFTEGARDEIISCVTELAGRLSTKGAELTTAAGDPALTPEEAAELAEQGAAISELGGKVGIFHTSLNGARTGQQEKEGAVDTLSTQVEVRRKEAAVALYGNLGQLMHEFRANPDAVAAYFDLDTLMKSGPDEEPVPPPANGGVTPP